MKTSVATLPGAPLGARQRWLVVGKIALVLAGLGLLVRWALAGLAPTDGSGALHLAPVGLVAAVLLNQAALFAAALRLRSTLAAFGVRLTAGQAMAIHLRSLFYFFFVPLSVGLEVSRYLDIRRLDADVPARTLVLVLLLDRVLGLVAAVAALAAFAYLVLPASVWAQINGRWLVLGALAVLAAGGGLVLLHRPWRERATDLLRVLRAGSVRLLVPVLLSLLALALVCASVYVVAAASGWAAGFAEIAFALSASLLGMALPLSLLGVTVGEATGVGVMALLGLAPALAVMLVSLAYVGRLLGAVQGAALELHGGVRVLRRQAAPGSGETL